MESYGGILRKKREEKNLDIDRISREISIDRKYLAALEEEDSSVFPGEAYLTGFLRNYSDYLDADTDFVMKLYHNKQLQEAPMPTELLKKSRPPFLIPSVIISVVVLVGFAVLIFFLLRGKNRREDESEVVISNRTGAKQYELGDDKLVQRVYKGDQFLIPTDSGKIVLTVRDTLGSFGLDTPAGIFYTDLAEENEMDINGDSKPDIIVYVSDISRTDASRGAEVSVLMRHGGSGFLTGIPAEEIPLISDIKITHAPKVILEDNRAYPFTLNASFRSPCLFRDRVDNGKSVESYFSRGEIFTATPRNGIRLWISNINNVKFTVVADSRTFDLDIGKAGQVVVEDIKWIKDTDGKYKLVVIELD